MDAVLPDGIVISHYQHMIIDDGRIGQLHFGKAIRNDGAGRIKDLTGRKASHFLQVARPGIFGKLPALRFRLC